MAFSPAAKLSTIGRSRSNLGPDDIPEIFAPSVHRVQSHGREDEILGRPRGTRHDEKNHAEPADRFGDRIGYRKTQERIQMERRPTFPGGKFQDAPGAMVVVHGHLGLKFQLTVQAFGPDILSGVTQKELGDKGIARPFTATPDEFDSVWQIKGKR